MNRMAKAAVDALRLEINQQTPQQLIRKITLETLANHYRQQELPDVFEKKKPGPDGTAEDRKSYSTQSTYELYLKNWILPRWRNLSFDGNQSRGCGEVAQGPMLPPDRHSVSEGYQGENQEHP